MVKYQASYVDLRHAARHGYNKIRAYLNCLEKTYGQEGKKQKALPREAFPGKDAPSAGSVGAASAPRSPKSSGVVRVVHF